MRERKRKGRCMRNVVCHLTCRGVKAVLLSAPPPPPTPPNHRPPKDQRVSIADLIHKIAVPFSPDGMFT